MQGETGNHCTHLRSPVVKVVNDLPPIEVSTDVSNFMQVVQELTGNQCNSHKKVSGIRIRVAHLCRADDTELQKAVPALKVRGQLLHGYFMRERDGRTLPHC